MPSGRPSADWVTTREPRALWNTTSASPPRTGCVLGRAPLNEEIAPAIRLQAASELVRHSGMSLEKVCDVNLTLNVGGDDAAHVISARLERLAATSPVIAGELTTLPEPDHAVVWDLDVSPAPESLN